MEELKTIVLSLGSNLGGKRKNIESAIQLLSEKILITKVSSFFETPPIGFQSDDQFYNICLIAKTSFSPNELLSFTQFVEKKIGRKEKSKNEAYQSRIIDVDIIFFEDEIVKTDFLNIPHKHFRHRRFVLEPLNEIASSFVDPISRLTIEQLCLDCEDSSKIYKIFL